MRKLWLLFLILLTTACKFDNNPSNKNQVQEEYVDKKKLRNWKCIPGKQVGLIEADDTEADIIAAYGKEYVIRRVIGVGEGEVTTATVVFPNTKNEIAVVWKPARAFIEIDVIIIEKPDASWQTDQKISTGTSLEELVKINGKDFQFFGFEWDYSGKTDGWNSGKISEYLTVFLEPAKPEVIYPELLGDEIFSSSHLKAKAADLKVRTMVITFD